MGPHGKHEQVKNERKNEGVPDSRSLAKSLAFFACHCSLSLIENLEQVTPNFVQ